MINSASIGDDIISYVYVGDFEIFGIPYPMQVLREDNIGLWWNFKDADTLSQTIKPFTPVNDGDPVAYVYDKGMHGINGSQQLTTRRVRYDSTNGTISSDMVDDALEVSFPNKIDSAYMVVDNYLGVYTYRINLDVNNLFMTSLYINRYLWDNVKNIFISTTLNEHEQSNIEKYYRNNNTPSIIKDFSSTWYACSALTEFPLIDTSSGTNFNNAWYRCGGLTEFPLIDTSSGTDFTSAWDACSGLTEFPLIDTSSGTDFIYAWRNCTSLTKFPLIDTSAGTDFRSAWYRCSSLTEFPLIDTSSGTDFSSAWEECSSLTEFPLINTSAGTNFSSAWHMCSSLTKFPLIDTSSGTNFINAWRFCSRLTEFPPNVFDNIKGGSFNNAFGYTNLTEESIDNILTSLVTSGISTGGRTFNQSGGSAPSVTIGQPAIDTLRARGWTITVTGGY